MKRVLTVAAAAGAVALLGPGATGIASAFSVPQTPRMATVGPSVRPATGRINYYRDVGWTTLTGGGTTIAVGSDGALWFIDGNLTDTAFSIARITTSGVITHFTNPRFTALGLNQIAAGPNGTLWFTINYPPAIGRITTSGSLKFFSDPGISTLGGIAEGPDGAMWYRTAGAIRRITTTGAIKTFASKRILGNGGIALGPGGAMWFTNDNGGNTPAGPDSIGRITTSGAITTYSAPSVSTAQPNAIGALHRGDLWFGSSQEIGVWRITGAGAITKYQGPSAINLYAVSLAAGPDGATWYTTGGDVIDRVSSSGLITGYTLPSGSTNASSIVAGPGDAMWFTFSGPGGTGEIGRLTLRPTLSGPLRVRSRTAAKLHGIAPRGASVTIEEAPQGKPFKAIGHTHASKNSGAFTFHAQVTGKDRFEAVVGQLTSQIIVIRT